MLPNALVQIHQALGRLAVLAFGHSFEGDGFCFAVVQNRPAGVGCQQALQPQPEAIFAVFPQGQDRPVGGAARGFKAAIGSAAQRQKAMQKIVSGVGIRFDVVEQHPRGIAELG